MKYINKYDLLINNNNEEKISKNYKNQNSIISGINVKSHLKLLENSYNIVKNKMDQFKKSVVNLQNEIDQIDLKLTAKNKEVIDIFNPKKMKTRKELEREIENQKNLKNYYEEELTNIKMELIDLQNIINEYTKKVKFLEDLGGLYTN